MRSQSSSGGRGRSDGQADIPCFLQERCRQSRRPRRRQSTAAALAWRRRRPAAVSPATILTAFNCAESTATHLQLGQAYGKRWEKIDCASQHDGLRLSDREPYAAVSTKNGSSHPQHSRYGTTIYSFLHVSHLLFLSHSRSFAASRNPTSE
jgi:hypothetical protein